MTIQNSHGQPVPDRYDYNKDGKFDHADVEEYIHEIGTGDNKGSAKVLLDLQKAGGEVNAKDWLDFIAEGGKVDGSDIEKFVEAGGKLTQQDLTALRAAGVDFTPKELKSIETKLGLEHTGRFPPGTTPADLLEMAKNGVKISAQDMIELKAADGKTPAFVDIKDLIKLQKLGGKVTGQDLIAFERSGGYVNGHHLADFVKAGGKLTANELVTLAKGGKGITEDQLRFIMKHGDIKLTAEQYQAINPMKDLLPDPVPYSVL